MAGELRKNVAAGMAENALEMVLRGMSPGAFPTWWDDGGAVGGVVD